MTAPRLILILAALEIGIVGLLYLFAPNLVLAPAGMVLQTASEFHATRAAYGGGFTGFALLWLAGALRPALARPALIALFVFMASFAAGRLVSLVLDGLPAPMFLGVLASELLLAPAALWALRRLPQG